MFPSADTQDIYWKLLDEDEDPVHDAAVAILKDAGQNYQSIQRMREGSNFLYALDEDRVFKICAPVFANEGLIEAQMLEATHKANLGLETPHILTQGVTHGWQWMVLTRISGTCGNIVWGKLSTDEKHCIIKKLGQWMRAFHAHEGIQSVRLPEAYEDWPTAQNKLRQGTLEKHRRTKASAHWLKQVEPYMEAWRPEFDTRIIHADLHPGNLILRQHEGHWELAGIVDFADTWRAPILYDLAAPLVYMSGGDASLTRTLLDAVGYQSPQKKLWQWILLHQYANLRYFTTMSTDLDQEGGMDQLADALLGSF